VTRIDHVLIATTNLQHGEQQLWRGYGLQCTPGGSHLPWGTSNLIVPIGQQYLELVAVENAELASVSLLGRAVLAAADRDRLVPIGLCLATVDLGAVATRLGLAVESGSRALADGTQIHWTSVGLAQAFGVSHLPFFISWETPAQHPSSARSDHRISPLEICEVEIGGSEPTLSERLGEDVPGVRAVGGPPGVRTVTIRLVDGSEVQLP